MKGINLRTKPLPCCGRCKKWRKGCPSEFASHLCEFFENDGTADDIRRYIH